MSRHFLRLSLVFSVLLLVLLAAACGGGAAPAPTAAPAKPAAAPTTAPAAAAPTKAPAAAAPKETVKWPTKAVTFITHTNPGAGGDLFNRAVAKAAEKVWGQPVVVENRPGGSGANAFIALKNAKPDGYTLMGQTPTLITATMTNKMPVTYKDFPPVARMVIDIMVLYAKADAPWKDGKAFFDDAKANPGKLRVGGGSVGSTDNFMVDQAELSSGGKIEYVPFESGAEVVAAVAGGHIAAGAGEYAEILPQVEAKKLKVLAVAANSRVPGIDAPTFKEQGIDSVMEKFRGFFAPGGTPKEVVDAVAAQLKKVHETDDFQNWAKMGNMVLAYQGPDDFAKAVEADASKFQAFLDRKGIKAK